MNLCILGLSDLRTLEQTIKVEISRRQSEEVMRARQQIFAIARSAGISLQDLVIAKGSGALKSASTLKGMKVPIQFRHPNDAALVWTGRGIKPKWITAWLADGGTMDQLRVGA